MRERDDSRTGTRPMAGDRFRQNPRIAQQLLGGKAVILHYEGKRILGLSEHGSAVWSRLDGRRSLQEIGAELAQEHGAPAAQVLDDVLEFVATLRERELVLEVPDSPGGSERDDGREPGHREE